MIRARRRWSGMALAVAAAAGLFFAFGQYRWWQAVYSVRQSLYRSDPEELIATLSQLQESNPDDGEIFYLLAVAHRRSGKTSRARQLLDSAQALGWRPTDIQRQQYLIRMQSGEIKETEDYLRALTAFGYPDEEASEIYECAARSYLANMQLHEANAVIWYWLQWRPDAVPPRVIKAELLNIVHDAPGEMREYQEILRLDPDNFKVRARFGHALLSANDLAGAQEQFEACSRIRPDSEAVSLGLAACYRRAGDLRKAESLVERALEGKLGNSEEAVALFELGQLALHRKEARKAIEYFDRAMKLAPNNPRLNYAYGVALTKIGEKNLANSYFEKSKSIEELGQRFIEVLDEITGQPNSADLRCEAGKLAMRLNHRSEAYRWLSSALHCEPRHGPTHQALAEYYVKAGRQDIAEQHLALAGSATASAVSANKD